jgi:hypothetical protein
MITCRSYTSSLKEKVANYSRHTCSRWQNALIPGVSFNDMTYAIVVSVPAKNIDIHNIHHHLSLK